MVRLTQKLQSFARSHVVPVSGRIPPGSKPTEPGQFGRNLLKALLISSEMITGGHPWCPGESRRTIDIKSWDAANRQWLPSEVRHNSSKQHGLVGRRNHQDQVSKHLRNPRRDFSEVGLFVLKVDVQHLVDVTVQAVGHGNSPLTPSVLANNGLVVLSSGVVSLSRISNKLTRSSAEPQRNIRWGTISLGSPASFSGIVFQKFGPVCFRIRVPAHLQHR
jgi:hypothetical protein